MCQTSYFNRRENRPSSRWVTLNQRLFRWVPRPPSVSTWQYRSNSLLLLDLWPVLAIYGLDIAAISSTIHRLTGIYHQPIRHWTTPHCGAYRHWCAGVYRLPDPFHPYWPLPAY